MRNNSFTRSGLPFLITVIPTASVNRWRRRLLSALDAYQRSNSVLTETDDPHVYAVRRGEIVLADDADWVKATEHLRQVFVEHAGLDVSIAGPISRAASHPLQARSQPR